MINRFKDHAANERTYLAWIRTAIAIMAFGFLLEKFDIFLSYIGHAIGNSTQFESTLSVEYIGLGLMFVSAAIIIGSTLRFFHTEKAIDADEQVIYSSKWPNLVLSVLMVLLAIFLIVYLIFQVT